MKSLCRLLPALALFASFHCASAWAAQTPFEESGGQKTPTYAQTMEWFGDLAESSPLIEVTSFGISAQGRDLPLVIADKDGRFD